MNEMTVRHQGGDRLEIDVRGHRVIVDQPAEVGGTDAGTLRCGPRELRRLLR